MKKRFKQLTALLLAMGLIGASLAGCGTDSKETANSSTEKATQSSTENDENSTQQDKVKDAAEPVTLTAMIAQSRNYDGLQKMIQKLKDEENITIELQVVPDDQYTNLMKMKVNSGESPDLIDYNLPGLFYELDPEQFFLDLTDEAWVKDLVSPDNIALDGKIYGYPFQSVQGVLGFVYNKDVFESMNIKEPTNWEELLTVCEKIKNEGDGITPIHLPKDAWVPQIYMTSNFATALGPDKGLETGKKLESNEMKWTEVKEFEQVLDTYLDLFKKGYINSDFTSVNYDNTIEAIGTGKAAMAYCGDFFGNSVLEAFPDANLGMFSAAMVGDSEYIAATTASVGFAGYKDSENADTIKKVFSLWATPEYGNLYFEGRPGFPALSQIDGGEVPDYLKAIDEKYIKTAKTVTEFNSCLTIGYNIAPDTLWLYYIDAPAKGDMTGAQLLDKFQGDFEKYMKEMKQPGF